ncbi:MAG: hypothetical protein PHE73_08790 [Sulfurovaceae bacterium]|nr:hypothetical protein [Sulfurovaceae bacterium]
MKLYYLIFPNGSTGIGTTPDLLQHSGEEPKEIIELTIDKKTMEEYINDPSIFKVDLEKKTLCKL